MCSNDDKPKGGGGLGRPMEPRFPERRPIQPHGGGLWGGPKDGGMAFRLLERVVQALGRRHGMA